MSDCWNIKLNTTSKSYKLDYILNWKFLKQQCTVWLVFFKVHKFREFRGCWSIMKFNPLKKITTHCSAWALGRSTRENKIVKSPKISHSRNLRKYCEKTNYTVQHNGRSKERCCRAISWTGGSSKHNTLQSWVVIRLLFTFCIYTTVHFLSSLNKCNCHSKMKSLQQ